MRRADIIVALGMMLVGIIALGDAIRLGFGWGISGPEAGFFPFYMGLGIFICTVFIVITAVKTYRKDGPGKPLIPEGGLTRILWILIPAIGVVLLTELIGLHLATVLPRFQHQGIGKDELGQGGPVECSGAFVHVHRL